MGNNCSSVKKEQEVNSIIDLKLKKLASLKQVNNNGLIVNNSLYVRQIHQDPMEKYTIIKFLGEGSFGRVNLVRNKETGIERAMKEIKKSESKNLQSEEEIINEIEILKNMDHPNIVKIFEFFVTIDKYYLITEYFSEETLFLKIKKFIRFTEDQAAYILYQLLSAINYCHLKQIVHRDLKPENILIDRIDKDGCFQIKVIDFGTAKIFDSEIKEKSFIGSKYYIAPEVIKKNYDEKCDLWSCGVILYILICGYAPFLGKTESEIFNKILIGKFDLTLHIWRKTSDEVKELITELLNLDTKSRLSASQALKHSWFKEKQFRENIYSISKEEILDYIQNLIAYNPDNKVQQAVLGFIVHHLPHSEDINKIKRFFHFLNKKKDGVISKSEFKNGIYKFIPKEEIENEIEKIFASIDADNNGFIEYAEFLTGCINKKKLIYNKELLKSAYDFFDKDGSGGITLDELLEVFFDKESEEKKNEYRKKLEFILKANDTNNDGEISYDEFFNMMIKIILS